MLDRLFMRIAGAALALSAALAGGCGRGRGPLDRATFEVGFGAGGCPEVVTVPEDQRNCPGLLGPKPDCVKVRHQATVAFTGAPADRVKPFAVYFTPFDAIRVERTRELKIDPQAPEKAYVFSVVAEGCPVLDPALIITH